MNRAILAMLSLGLAAIPGVAAAPPPIIIAPDTLATPIEGYNLAPVFRDWVYWVESRKGVAADELLKNAEHLPYERPFGLILRVKWIEYDFGHTASADLKPYCETGTGRRFESKPGTCHYRLRRVIVPHMAAPYRRESAISGWVREAFDAKALVAHFKHHGVAPERLPGLGDADTMFSVLPSPVPVLKANAQVDVIDSRDCPEMGRRIEAVEQARLDLPLDLDGVAQDTPPTLPAFHGVQVVYSLRVRAKGGTGVTLEGTGEMLTKLAAPILEAAAACKPSPTYR